MIQFIVTWTANFIPLWLLCFVVDMYAEKKDVSKNKRILILLCFALMITLVNQLHIPVLNASVSLTLYIGAILLLFHIVWYNAILLAGIVWSVVAFAETTASVLWSNILDEQLTAAFFVEDLAMIVAQSVSMLFVLIVFYIFRTIIQRRKDERKLPQNLAVVLFPIASALTAYYIIATIVDVFSRQVMVYMGVFLAVFLVAINIASLIGNENVRKRYMLQNEIDAMHHQEELAVGLLHQQEEYLKKMRAQSHDFKNHLLCLQALVRDKAPGQSSTSQYIDELLSAVDGLEQYTEVQNESLRAIIINTAVACKEADIEFRIRMEYSDFAFMTFSDISVLFSNALDNAMEASVKCIGESNRFIDLKILRKGEMIFIQVVNSKCNEVKINNDKMISTKQDFYNHGIGFKNIERVIKKYEGNITMDYDEFEFRLYINLPASDDILEEQI